MRKLLFLLFTVLATLAILNCSADDGMPCFGCYEPFPPQEQPLYPTPVPVYTYCFYYDSNYGYYECSYTPYCNGTNYGDDNTCGGNVLPP